MKLWLLCFFFFGFLFLFCMSEVLLEMQTGWERRGKVAIRNTSGERNRASETQTQMRRIVRCQDKEKGEKDTRQLQTQRRPRKGWYQSKWHITERESVRRFLIPANKQRSSFSSGPMVSESCLSSDNASQSSLITPSKSIITKPKHVFAI